MKPIAFKEATLCTNDENIKGILVIHNKEITCDSIEIPKKIFVPINEEVFYTNNYDYLDKILQDCINQGMLSINNQVNLICPFINEEFFDEKTGLIISFYQPSAKFQGCPVHIKVYEIQEYFKQISILKSMKNEMIKIMLEKNPPDDIKNILYCETL